MIKQITVRILSLLCAVLAISPACAEPEIIVPDEYTLSGTLPVYAAVERDFLQIVQPEFINPSGAKEIVTGKHSYTCITFSDEAQLEWDKNSLYYETYDGTCEITYELAMTGEKVTTTQPKPDMRNAARTLASWMIHGWPVTDEVYTLESTTLNGITLDEAQNRAQQLFEILGLEGYVCESAIDMNLSRIQEMGAKWNKLLEEGHMLNNPVLDYSTATMQDEGYYLIYNRFGTDGDQAGMFHASLYVTAKGISYINLHDRYAVGTVCETPEKLVDWQTVMAALPKELKSSRMALELENVSRIRLTWCPVRSKLTDSGLAITPAWILTFSCSNDEQENDDYYAAFSAVDGRLIDANWI